MSKLTKLLQKIKNLDKGLRFDEIRKVLVLYGYEMNFPHGGSSHATFRKNDQMPIITRLACPAYSLRMDTIAIR